MIGILKEAGCRKKGLVDELVATEKGQKDAGIK